MNPDEIKTQWNDYFKSDKFKQDIADFARREEEQKAMAASQIERFHAKYGDKLYDTIIKIVAKYKSAAYFKRERKLGREPITELFWFLLSYARKYGTRIPNKHYRNYKQLNTFTTEAYLLDRFVIQRMDGQGSVVHVDELPADFVLVKKDTYAATFGNQAVTFFMDTYCAEHPEISEKLRHRLFKIMDISNQHYVNFKSMLEGGYYISFYKNTTLKFIKEMFNSLIRDYPEHKDLITGGVNYVVTKFRTLKLDPNDQTFYSVKGQKRNPSK